MSIIHQVSSKYQVSSMDYVIDFMVITRTRGATLRTLDGSMAALHGEALTVVDVTWAGGFFHEIFL